MVENATKLDLLVNARCQRLDEWLCCNAHIGM